MTATLHKKGGTYFIDEIFLDKEYKVLSIKCEPRSEWDKGQKFTILLSKEDIIKLRIVKEQMELFE